MNPKIIACVVGHDLKEGSFVAQVPVFPPFNQSTGDESSSDWQVWCENAVDACIGTLKPKQNSYLGDFYFLFLLQRSFFSLCHACTLNIFSVTLLSFVFCLLSFVFCLFSSFPFSFFRNFWLGENDSLQSCLEHGFLVR